MYLSSNASCSLTLWQRGILLMLIRLFWKVFPLIISPLHSLIALSLNGHQLMAVKQITGIRDGVRAVLFKNPLMMIRCLIFTPSFSCRTELWHRQHRAAGGESGFGDYSLEGVTIPFLIWTDHRNLEYIWSAKWLNSRQAHWALFFGHFDFMLSYRSCYKTVRRLQDEWWGPFCGSSRAKSGKP